MHQAELQLTQHELAANYGLRENLQLSLRLPYQVKDLEIRYTTLDGAPFTPPYGDIHHRSETLTGISDPSLTLETERGDFLLGVGTTIPAGHIEPDPIALGRAGQRHEHIQFGSGTFRPIVSAQWVRRGTVTLFARGEARVSLYENREGFRAPTDFLWSLGPGFRAGRFSIDPRFSGQWQTLGRWSGEVDEGTGFRNGGVRLQVSAPVGRVVLAPSVYRELFSKGAHHGESFRQGTTWSLAVVRTF